MVSTLVAPRGTSNLAPGSQISRLTWLPATERPGEAGAPVRARERAGTVTASSSLASTVAGFGVRGLGGICREAQHRDGGWPPSRWRRIPGRAGPPGRGARAYVKQLWPHRRLAGRSERTPGQPPAPVARPPRLPCGPGAIHPTHADRGQPVPRMLDEQRGSNPEVFGRLQDHPHLRARLQPGGERRVELHSPPGLPRSFERDRGRIGREARKRRILRPNTERGGGARGSDGAVLRPSA